MPHWLVTLLQVTAALGGMGGFCTGGAAVLVAARGRREAKAAVVELHVQLNDRLSQLIEATKSAAHAEGVAQERTEARLRADQADIPDKQGTLDQVKAATADLPLTKPKF
jgi:dienelactone hydrolase